MIQSGKSQSCKNLSRFLALLFFYCSDPAPLERILHGVSQHRAYVNGRRGPPHRHSQPETKCWEKGK